MAHPSSPARGASPPTSTEVESAPARMPSADSPTGQERERRGRRRSRGVLNNILSREHVPADLVFMVVNVCVAGAVLGTGFFLSLVPERPLYGTLSASAVDVHRAKRLGSLLAITSGGYVLGITAVGLLSRKLRSRPLYGMYNGLNILGVGLCMATAIWPNLLATSHRSFCSAAAEECKSVPDLASCPYSTSKVTLAKSALAERRVWALSAHMDDTKRAGATMVRRHASAVSSSGVRRALVSESQCCYTPEFEAACGRLYGAAWLLTVLASALVCVVAAQSTLACGVLCWDTDLFASPLPSGRRAQEPASASHAVAAAAAPSQPSKAKGDEAEEASSVRVSSPVRPVSRPHHPQTAEEVGRQDEKMESGASDDYHLDA